MLADDYVDWYVSQQSLQPQLKIFAIVLLLLYVHPIATKGTPSFTDTIVTSSVLCAIIIQRSQRTRLIGNLAVLESEPHISTFNFLKLWVLRLVLGSAIIGILKVVLISIIKPTVIICYRIAGLDMLSSSSIKKSLPKHSRHYTADFKIPPVELPDDALLYDECESDEEELLSDADDEEGEDPSSSSKKKERPSSLKMMTDLLLLHHLHLIAVPPHLIHIHRTEEHHREALRAVF
jgi:hypothetical protein